MKPAANVSTVDIEGERARVRARQGILVIVGDGTCDRCQVAGELYGERDSLDAVCSNCAAAYDAQMMVRSNVAEGLRIFVASLGSGESAYAWLWLNRSDWGMHLQRGDTSAPDHHGPSGYAVRRAIHSNETSGDCEINAKYLLRLMFQAMKKGDEAQ